MCVCVSERDKREKEREREYALYHRRDSFRMLRSGIKIYTLMCAHAASVLQCLHLHLCGCIFVFRRFCVCIAVLFSHVALYVVLCCFVRVGSSRTSVRRLSRMALLKLGAREKIKIALSKEIGRIEHIWFRRAKLFAGVM